MGALREIIEQEERMADELEDKLHADLTYREPESVQITDEWDTMMDEYMDDFQDFGESDSF
ncbi:MAG: hypothetical protein OEW58_03190 [Gammaproteobacteria bacterium]|nr:hypothetical protein [Gammaproteobacteria bacterium]